MTRRIRTLLATTLISALAGLGAVTAGAASGGDDTGWGTPPSAAGTTADDTGWGAPVAGAGTHDTGWG